MKSPATNRARTTRRPTGMTLVEILTVVAIIGVLVALLLPAIQAARESARRTTCQNHLRQNALAVLQDADANGGELPALWRTSLRDVWQNFPWRIDVLDELEQGPLAEKLQLRSLPLDDVNRPLLSEKLPTMECPSSPDSPRTITQLGNVRVGRGDSLRLGATDYAAVFDVKLDNVVEPLSGAWRSPAAAKLGTKAGGSDIPIDLIGPRRRVLPNALRTITDGLSKTILLTEQAGKPTRYAESAKGQVETPSEGAWGTGELAAFGMVGVNRDNQLGPYGFHQGANVALCDASVLMLVDDVEPAVLAAMLTRDGEEIIDSADWRSSR